MTQYASKQGKFGSLGAIFLFIFLPCMWGLGSQNESPLTGCQRRNGTPVDANGTDVHPWVSDIWPGTVLRICQLNVTLPLTQKLIRKRGGVQKSMGNKVPWKTGVVICHLVTSRPLIFLQKEVVLSPCNFATTHLTACILNFYLP